jgi:3-hydroxyisobutyrate dehydrogenase-like beta-hydroxyacid dehydrogenase
MASLGWIGLGRMGQPMAMPLNELAARLFERFSSN